jgi:hypothetical protein
MMGSICTLTDRLEPYWMGQIPHRISRILWTKVTTMCEFPAMHI